MIAISTNAIFRNGRGTKVVELSPELLVDSDRAENLPQGRSRDVVLSWNDGEENVALLINPVDLIALAHLAKMGVI